MDLHRFLTGSRPPHSVYFTVLALVASSRGSCARRKTGCVLVDEHNHVLSTGYNGPPAGWPNCTEQACGGVHHRSGEGLDECIAIHAEANALLQCADTNAIHTAYCTTEPCIHCAKLLANTGCRKVVYYEPYPHSSVSRNFWISLPGKREWIRQPIPQA